MARTLALIGLVAALAAPQAGLAQSNAPSGYGTEGPYGEQLPPAYATSTYARYYNNYNQARYRAEQSADWLRTHGRGAAPGY
jgi:hypothetical protein